MLKVNYIGLFVFASTLAFGDVRPRNVTFDAHNASNIIQTFIQSLNTDWRIRTPVNANNPITFSYHMAHTNLSLASGAHGGIGGITGFVPTNRTVTINGVTKALSSNITFTVSSTNIPTLQQVYNAGSSSITNNSGYVHTYGGASTEYEWSGIWYNPGVKIFDFANQLIRDRSNVVAIGWGVTNQINFYNRDLTNIAAITLGGERKTAWPTGGGLTNNAGSSVTLAQTNHTIIANTQVFTGVAVSNYVANIGSMRGKVMAVDTNGQLNLAAGVATKILLDVAVYDDMSGWNLANNRINIKLAGWYEATSQIQWLNADGNAFRHHYRVWKGSGYPTNTTVVPSINAGLNATAQTWSSLVPQLIYFPQTNGWIELYGTWLVVSTVDIGGAVTNLYYPRTWLYVRRVAP